MANLLNYLLYAAVFIAAVFLVEGAWFMVRGLAGEDRVIRNRLARIRRAAIPREKPVRRPLDEWLEQRLPALARVLVRARAPFGPQVVIIAGVAIAILAGVLLTLARAPIFIAIPAGLLLGAGVPLSLVNGMAVRRRKKFAAQLPQAVDLIARSLQAGHPVTSAIGVVGKQMPDPIGPEFSVVIEEMTYGLDRDKALGNLVQRFPLPEMRMFTASLEVTRESGGNLAEVFLTLGDTLRAKFQMRKKVEAISAEGRLSMYVVSSLPVVVAGAIMLLRPGFYTEVIGDPLFWPMISMAPVMIAVGVFIISRMINFKI